MISGKISTDHQRSFRAEHAPIMPASEKESGCAFATMVTFPATTLTLRVGVPAEIVPTLSGPAFDAFEISPDLPEGLELDVLTGTISGTPSVVDARTVYTVTGLRVAEPGDEATTVRIAVARRCVYYGPADCGVSAGAGRTRGVGSLGWSSEPPAWAARACPKQNDPRVTANHCPGYLCGRNKAYGFTGYC
jgi:hypothetical protein